MHSRKRGIITTPVTDHGIIPRYTGMNTWPARNWGTTANAGEPKPGRLWHFRACPLQENEMCSVEREPRIVVESPSNKMSV